MFGTVPNEVLDQNSDLEPLNLRNIPREYEKRQLYIFMIILYDQNQQPLVAHC